MFYSEFKNLRIINLNKTSCIKSSLSVSDKSKCKYVIFPIFVSNLRFFKLLITKFLVKEPPIGR